MSPWIDPLTISESPKSGHSSKQIQVQDVETGEMGSVNGAETSSHKQEVTFNAENHRFGNTVVSDHANAILGNVHYVYNFCCSPERIASYRRSAVSCLRDTFKEFLGDPEPSEAHSEFQSNRIGRSTDQVYTIDPAVTQNALATAVQEANEKNCTLEVSEDAFAALFQPFDVVVADEGGDLRAYQVDSIVHKDRHSVELKLWAWEFDGDFRKSPFIDTVTHPGQDARVPITSLHYWPIRFGGLEIEATLRARGQFFWTMRRRRMVEYTYSESGYHEVRTKTSRYIVDMAAYRMLHPEGAPIEKDRIVLAKTLVAMDEPPAGHFVLLLPSRIKGFGFHDKKWRNLRIECIRDVCWNKEAFRQLVLDKRQKELLRAVTTQLAVGEDSTAPGHYQRAGLKLLFHGPPGTGKHLAAESVAEIVERPLYTISFGDMGTDTDSVEKYLESAFFIGTMWGCVVLLSDADFLLEQRERTDIHGSALMSTFLRALDNYEGILIFSASRTFTFDAAVRSRIHLAIHFPGLGKDQRAAIWKHFIEGLEDEGVEMDSEEIMEEVFEFAEIELNGRQIGNIVATARRIASFERRMLKVRHFKSIIEFTKQFEGHFSTTSRYQERRRTQDSSPSR